MAQRVSSDSDVDHDDDVDDEEVDDNDESVDDDNDDDEGEEEATPTPEQRRTHKLTQEAARHRIRAKKALARVQALEEENRKLKEEGVTGDQAKEMKTENERLRQETEALANEVKTLKIGEAIRNGMSDLNLNTKRARSIVKLIDLDDIEVDEDGEVSGVTEALEHIAQEYPEWVIKSQGDDDDEKESTNGRASGQSSRKPGRQKRTGVDQKDLLNKFPALQQGYRG